MHDDFDDDWGYNGDAEHDMWVDYTTDIYEGTNYSGENPEYIPTPHSYNTPKPRHISVPKLADDLESIHSRISTLEGLIAAAFASAVALDEKSKNASTVKNIHKYSRRAAEKQSEAIKYQKELDSLMPKYKSALLKREMATTRLVAILCCAVCFLAIFVAWTY